MKCQLLLLVVLFIRDSHFRKITTTKPDDDTLCIAQHLVDRGMLTREELKLNAFEVHRNCSEKILQADKEFYRQISKFTTDDKSVQTCAVRTMKEHNVMDFIFREILTYHYDANDKKVLKDLKTIQQRYATAAKLICHHQDIFAPNINEKFENLKNSNVDVNDIYEFNEIKHCVKSHLLANDVINVTTLKVNINARNIDAEDLAELDCKEVVDDLYLTMERDIDEIITPSKAAGFVSTDCVLEKAEQNSFLEKMFAYVFLIHSPDISKENIRKLKKRAGEMEKSVTNYMFDCVTLH